MRAAIVVAGGTGERFGRAGGKQLAMVGDIPLVTYALRAFDNAVCIDVTVLVCAAEDIEECLLTAVRGPGIRKVSSVVAGGVSRRLSVAAGLAALPRGVDIVAVHDGARPLVLPETVEAAVVELEGSPGVDGVVVGHPSYDTIKVVGPGLDVVATPERSTLWIAQTPQVFRSDALMRAHALADSEGWEATDDAALVERCGGGLRMIEGPRWNIKVTVPEDLPLVEALLADRGGR